MCFEIDISGSDAVDWLDSETLHAALQTALKLERVCQAVLSISVVDNDTIHRLNRDYLKHDYATDVISFQLDWSAAGRQAPGHASEGRSAEAAIEGEIVVSWQYAEEMAERCGWEPCHELTLYAVHGMLHICGYDDLTAAEKQIMRSRERFIMKYLGGTPNYPDENVAEEEPPGSPDTNVVSHESSEGRL